jgi:uncharacterized DUF497 family protein
MLEKDNKMEERKMKNNEMDMREAVEVLRDKLHKAVKRIADDKVKKCLIAIAEPKEEDFDMHTERNEQGDLVIIVERKAAKRTEVVKFDEIAREVFKGTPLEELANEKLHPSMNFPHVFGSKNKD